MAAYKRDKIVSTGHKQLGKIDVVNCSEGIEGRAEQRRRRRAEREVEERERKNERQAKNEVGITPKTDGHIGCCLLVLLLLCLLLLLIAK